MNDTSLQLSPQISALFESAPGVHLLRIEPGDKCPVKGSQWKDRPLSVDDAIKWAEAGHRLGIVPASVKAAVVDIDNGGQASLDLVKQTLGDPVAIIDTLSNTPEKMRVHCVYAHDQSTRVGNAKWQGGDIRVDEGYVVMWDIPKWIDAIARIHIQDIQPADILKMRTARSPLVETIISEAAVGRHDSCKSDLAKISMQETDYQTAMTKVEARLEIMRAQCADNKKRLKEFETGERDRFIDFFNLTWSKDQKRVEERKQAKVVKECVDIPDNDLIWISPKVVKSPSPVSIEAIFNELEMQWRYNYILDIQDVKCQKLGYVDWTEASEKVRLDIAVKISKSYVYMAGKNEVVFDVLTTHHDKFKRLSKTKAYRSSYHPLLEYIDRLPEWDGESRLKSTYSDMGLSMDAGEYQAWAESYPYVECYIRAKYPETSRRSHPLLRGERFIGKSAYGAVALPKQLGGISADEKPKSSYFNDDFSFEGGTKKERQEAIKGMILCEASDIDKSIGRERGALKSFLSGKTSGGVRHAYAEDIDRSLRTATLYFTTNDVVLPDDDPAISTRMIQIKVGGFANRKANVAYPEMGELVDQSDPSKGTRRDQLWAEAKYRVEETKQWIDGMEVVENPFLDDDMIMRAPRWNYDQGGTFTTKDGALRQDHLYALDKLAIRENGRITGFRDFVSTDEMIKIMFQNSMAGEMATDLTKDRTFAEYAGTNAKINIITGVVSMVGLYQHGHRQMDAVRRRGFYLTNDQPKIDNMIRIIDPPQKNTGLLDGIDDISGS